jgi:CheY-like chemotaxis protein
MILLDIMMPEVDGLQILDSLKSDPELKDIPVMTFTNLSNDKIRELALAKGAVEYIDKSKFKPRQIVARVKAYYDQA